MHCGRCGRRFVAAAASWTDTWGGVCPDCLLAVCRKASLEREEWKRAREAKTDVLVQGVPVATPGERGEVQPASSETANQSEVRVHAEGKREVEALPLTYGDAPARKGRA
jgi:hypothetical protein